MGLTKAKCKDCGKGFETIDYDGFLISRVCPECKVH